MRMKCSLIAVLLVLLCCSCEKEVQIDLAATEGKVVVEGAIETGLPPYVFLSRSIGFFSRVDLNTLNNSFLHGARITVGDGTRSVGLREYTFRTNGINLYFYSVDSADVNALSFRGEAGKTYSLRIEYEGKTYESSALIPYPSRLDSLWAEPPPPSEMPEGYPNSMLLFARYTDPDTPGNRVRYYTQRNGQSFLAPYYSVYDDAIVNGTRVDIQLSAGFNRMDSIDLNTFGYFYRGDTVVVKWCSIDKAVFDFWRTLEFSYGSTGNPFASPVEVTTNIRGGALGVWAGYGSTFDTLVIPR